MSDDDDGYVEGDSGSEPADAPGEIPTETERPERGGEIIDSVAAQDAPEQHLKRSAARSTAARKAFVEAILANKAKAKPADAEPDPEDEALAAAEPEKPVVAEAPKPAAVAAPPPAPSLDPEVRRIKEQLAAERKALEAERAELEKRKAEPVEAPVDALNLEDYIDSPHRAYRNWLEAMRGEKFATDDEFKGEVKDFITAMSTDVLGVPLPENVKAQFDAAQARKIVKTHRTIQERKAAAAAAKAEKERIAAQEKAALDQIEREWASAALTVSKMFAHAADAEGKPIPSDAAKAYPWLAVEENPGELIVDVIRKAHANDGTELSWQEASKRADEYLQGQYKESVKKRRALMRDWFKDDGAPVAAPAPISGKPRPAAPVVAPAPPPAPKPEKWSREKHMEKTKRAFMATIAAAKTE